jgi:hypothetical protein
MDRASYYREQADHVRQLAEMTWQDDLGALLRRVAQDYDEIAENIEAGATEVRRSITCTSILSGTSGNRKIGKLLQSLLVILVSSKLTPSYE